MTTPLITHRIQAPSTRKDGAVRIDVTVEEASHLRSYVGATEADARDNARDPGDRADLNAAVALLRHLGPESR